MVLVACLERGSLQFSEGNYDHQYYSKPYRRFSPSFSQDSAGIAHSLHFGSDRSDADRNTPPDVHTQADVVYGKIVQSLNDAGMDVTDIVKTNVYLINAGYIGALIEAGKNISKGIPSRHARLREGTGTA